MLPDVSGIHKAFDYLVPPALEETPAVGTVVRVPLGGRRVRGWVVEGDAAPPGGVVLRPLIEVVSLGPSPEVVALARWSAWRWAGPLRPFLLAASPPRIVLSVPRARSVRPAVRPAADAERSAREVAAAAREAVETGGTSVVRLPPASSRLRLLREVLDLRMGDHGDVLVLLPTRAEAELLGDLLVREGWPVALQPDAWARAAAGGSVVVGARGAAFAPVGRLGAVVVLDAHSESFADTRAPTWNAAEVAAERARRAGVPCLLVSPVPPLELLGSRPLVTLPRAFEREGWPVLEVLDRRGDDPRSGRYAPKLAALARQAAGDPDRPVVFVLNRTGRARLLACRGCGELARCEACGAATIQAAATAVGGAGHLDCPRCGLRRPVVCAGCGSMNLAIVRAGTARAREEVEALTGLPTEEVTAGSERRTGPPGGGRPLAIVGTEAALRRLRSASLAVFLDIDQELLAPRFRAGEETLALLALAARLVGGRRRSGRVVVQTRLPEHEVIRAVLRADPGVVAEAEMERRADLRLPPASALAVVEGEGAAAFAAALEGLGVEVAETGPERLLVRAAGREQLCDALEAAAGSTDAVRVEVDPRRL